MTEPPVAPANVIVTIGVDTPATSTSPSRRISWDRGSATSPCPPRRRATGSWGGEHLPTFAGVRYVFLPAAASCGLAAALALGLYRIAPPVRRRRPGRRGTAGHTGAAAPSGTGGSALVGQGGPQLAQRRDDPR